MGLFGEEKYLLPMPGIELRFLGFPRLEYAERGGGGGNTAILQEEILECSKTAFGYIRGAQKKSTNTTQTANQPKFIPPKISPGQPRPLSLARPVKALSLTSKSLALAYSPVRVKVSVIEPSYAVKRRYG
jgi:hypothetical protein